MSRIFAIALILMFAHYLYLLTNKSANPGTELLENLRAAEQKLAPLEKLSRDTKALVQKLHQLTTDAPMEQVSRDDLSVPHNAPVTLSGLKEIEAQSIAAELLHEKTELLTREMSKQILALSRLVDYFEDQKELRVLMPSIKPVKGNLSSPFGPRLDPYSGEATMHTGVDFAAPEGTLIMAPAFGRVIFFANDGALGNLLVIDHGAGIQTQYGHLKEALVEVGTVVERGQAIAQVGNTGKSTGPHLHYEVRKLGIPQNPMQYIID